MAQYIIDNLPGPIEFNPKTATDRLLQRCKNLIMTRMGEVPFDRYRGLDPAYRDMPITRLREELIEEIDRIMLWCDDVEVTDCQCSLARNGDLLIRVTIETEIED